MVVTGLGVSIGDKASCIWCYKRGPILGSAARYLVMVIYIWCGHPLLLVAVLPDSRGRVVAWCGLVWYGIALLGVGASCSPFKVDPRQSAGQARGARPPAGMCTRQGGGGGGG